MTDLKDCPFCGWPANLYMRIINKSKRRSFVKCSNDLCQATHRPDIDHLDRYTDDDESQKTQAERFAIKRWNKRA